MESNEQQYIFKQKEIHTYWNWMKYNKKTKTAKKVKTKNGNSATNNHYEATAAAAYIFFLYFMLVWLGLVLFFAVVGCRPFDAFVNFYFSIFQTKSARPLRPPPLFNAVILHIVLFIFFLPLYSVFHHLVLWL